MTGGWGVGVGTGVCPFRLSRPLNRVCDKTLTVKSQCFRRKPAAAYIYTVSNYKNVPRGSIMMVKPARACGRVQQSNEINYRSAATDPPGRRDDDRAAPALYV